MSWLKIEKKAEAPKSNLSLTGGARIFRSALVSARASRAKRGRRRMAGGGSKQKLAVPPSIDCVAVFARTYRFVATNNVSATNITVLQLLGIAGNIGTVLNTTMVTIASSLRLKRVTLWTPATAAGSVVNELAWSSSAASGFIRDESKNQSLPAGVAITGAQVYTPPRHSTLVDWLASAIDALNVFTITLTAGSIVDIDIAHTVANDIANLPISVGAAVVGKLYYGYLDQGGAHLIQPVGVGSSFTF